MTKAYLIAGVLLAATTFASMQSCKKKSDASPSNRITAITDSVVYTGGSSGTTASVSSINLSYNDDKLSMVKITTKDYQSGGVQYDSSTRTYNYVDGKCIITTTNRTDVDTVYLDGEKISRYNTYAVTYVDGTNKVKSYRGSEYTWTGDNLSSAIGVDTLTFTYNTSKDASMANMFVLGEYLNYGRALTNNKNLITSAKQAGSSGGQENTYEYTFDGSGRVTNAVQTTTSFGPGASGTWKSYLSYQY